MRTGPALLWLALAFWAAAPSGLPARAGDRPSPGAAARGWPMYRANAGRDGYTPEKLPDKLAVRWVYKSHPPRPAWPHVRYSNSRSPTSFDYDRVCQPVVAGGLVFFGSSADDKVYALDAATGREKWSFFAGGPVRFAPAAWRDRLFAGSDDGWLYCLEAATGKLLWKHRGGPGDDKVIGNDRIVSRWPVRGGPVVLEDKVYFAAGIWPADRAYVHALDAATGKPQWTADAGDAVAGWAKSGPLPTGMAFQGYLAAAGDRLAVPTGHEFPAVYQRGTGKLAYCSGGGYGAAAAVIVDGVLFHTWGAYDLKTGSALFTALDQRHGVNPWNVTATLKWILWIASGNSSLSGAERAGAFGGAADPGKKRLEVKWSLRVKSACELIAAGDRAYVGADNQVLAVDIETAKVVWTVPVEGAACGLAAAAGRLFVSTTQGHVYCLDGSGGAAEVLAPKTAADQAADGACRQAAEEILKQFGAGEGFCADLGCGDGGLALELARRSKLRICAVEKDPAAVERARRRLDAAGLYGTRAAVIEADPGKTLLPRWHADLVVSGRSVTEGADAASAAEAARLQRPYGGTVLLGKPGAMKKSVRGPLQGAGSWTNQFADAGNSRCSGDTLIKGTLRTHWYRDPEVQVGHVDAPEPVCLDGRLFVPGRDGIYAVDVYNGRTLWKLPIEKYSASGYAGDAGSSLCVSPQGVYARHGAKILRIDAATGRQLAAFEAPKGPDGQPGAWGHVLFDGDTLYGAVANKQAAYCPERDMYRTKATMESSELVAMDPETGKVKWTHKAKDSLLNMAMAVGGGRVYLIDRPYKLTDPKYGRPCYDVDGELRALDAKDGKVLWKKDQGVFGVVLALSPRHDVLVMAHNGCNKGYKMYAEYRGPSKELKVVAFRASDGEQLWGQKGAYGWYQSPPILVDQTVYLQPAGYDLLTGKPRPGKETGKPWMLPRKTGTGCGTISAAQNMLLYRHGVIAYYDLLRDAGQEYYGGIRPGCNLNIIPAGGLVLVPEYSANCICNFIKAWVALAPAE